MALQDNIHVLDKFTRKVSSTKTANAQFIRTYKPPSLLKVST